MALPALPGTAPLVLIECMIKESKSIEVFSSPEQFQPNFSIYLFNLDEIHCSYSIKRPSEQIIPSFPCLGTTMYKHE